ncbi:phosphoenolpyruvate carboxykinase (ATP) [Emticicia fontis]
MFKYWGFGLKILSEIEFPELFSFDFEVQDITITFGLIPPVSESIQTGLGKIAHTPDTFLLDIEPVAKYFAINGNSILIEPYTDEIEPRSVRIYALATAMAAILAQRSLLPLHAASVLINDKLTLITGESTAGKSTSIAGLIKRGYKIFSDDVLVLDQLGNDQIGGIASYPMIKLWEDAVDKLESEIFEDKSFRVRGDLSKFGFFFHDHFITDCHPIEKVIVLSKSNTKAISYTQLKGFEAFSVLQKQIYRPFLFQTNRLQLLQFDRISKLVNNCVVYKVIRPNVFDSEDLQKFIIELIND